MSKLLYQEALDRLKKVKKIHADQSMALCPAHNDKNPSLSVGRGREGNAVFYCFAGCTFDEIKEAINK
jgi:DNA primase